MAFAPTKRWKSPSITTWEDSRNQNQPTDSAEEAPLFQRMALPVTAGKTKIAGIKIHDTRMMRLMEVLLHGGTQLNGWRSADIHQAVLMTFGLAANTYTLTQLRYDLRKMKAHGLIERIGRSYRCRLSDQGAKAALHVHPIPQARL